MMDKWKLVPVEPTCEMIDAGDASFAFNVSKIYGAMLAAAPQPPAFGEPVQRYTEGQIGKGIYKDPTGELCAYFHVARLQAEVERLNDQLSSEQDRVMATIGQYAKFGTRNAELEGLCDQVKEAYKFLKLCREDKTDTAIDTGAMRDAREWLRKAAESLGAALAEDKEHE